MAGERHARITSTQEEYLSLLRSALWDTPATLPHDLDGVRKIAQVQRTRPMIISALLNAGWQCSNPQPIELVHKTAATHIQLNRCIAKVVSALREGGVEPVLLKGQGVARNYLQPLLRECGDIDLYVGPDQFERACEIINGMATEAEIAKAKDSTLHYEIFLGKMLIELHRVSDKMNSSKADGIYQALANDGLSNNLAPVDFEGVMVNTPSNSFNAFYIFCHMQRHFLTEGIGLRQMCDWIRFLHTHSGKLDEAYLGKVLDSLQLRIVWTMFASIAVDFLGLPAEDMPLYQPGLKEDAAIVLETIFMEGNFGHYRFGQNRDLTQTDRPENYIASKTYSIKTRLERYRLMRRMYPGERRFLRKKILNFYSVGVVQVIKDIFHK